jgi:hypothetical protein
MKPAVENSSIRVVAAATGAAAVFLPSSAPNVFATTKQSSSSALPVIEAVSNRKNSLHRLTATAPDTTNVHV